jgi:hypothetical protein
MIGMSTFEHDCVWQRGGPQESQPLLAGGGDAHFMPQTAQDLLDRFREVSIVIHDEKVRHACKSGGSPGQRPAGPMAGRLLRSATALTAKGRVAASD